MSVVDPIADMLTRIRNAHLALHKELTVPKSKLKLAIAEILQEEGYIEQLEEEQRDIHLRLKYVKGNAAISGLKRVSKPSCRRYVDVDSIPRVQNGLGINILSTSKGVLEGQRAKEMNVGGELLCQIW